MSNWSLVFCFLKTKIQIVKLTLSVCKVKQCHFKLLQFTTIATLYFIIQFSAFGVFGKFVLEMSEPHKHSIRDSFFEFTTSIKHSILPVKNAKENQVKKQNHFLLFQRGDFFENNQNYCFLFIWNWNLISLFQIFLSFPNFFCFFINLDFPITNRQKRKKKKKIHSEKTSSFDCWRMFFKFQSPEFHCLLF